MDLENFFGGLTRGAQLLLHPWPKEEWSSCITQGHPLGPRGSRSFGRGGHGVGEGGRDTAQPTRSAESTLAINGMTDVPARLLTHSSNFTVTKLNSSHWPLHKQKTMYIEDKKLPLGVKKCSRNGNYFDCFSINITIFHYSSVKVVVWQLSSPLGQIIAWFKNQYNYKIIQSLQKGEAF